MDDNERRRYEMLVRVRQFGTDNAGDFPGGTIGDTQFTVVGTSVDSVESEAGKQQAGFGEASQQFEVKGTARENLREQMSDIARTARSMEYQFDGISNKFRMPRNRNDADLLNKGRAFFHVTTPAHLKLNGMHAIIRPTVVARDVAALESGIDDVTKLRLRLQQIR